MAARSCAASAIGRRRFWTWLNRRAYAVYIIHPPVLVGVSVLLHPWIAPALLKFAVTGTLSCAACWLISDPLVRDARPAPHSLTTVCGLQGIDRRLRFAHKKIASEGILRFGGACVVTRIEDGDQ